MRCGRPPLSYSAAVDFFPGRNAKYWHLVGMHARPFNPRPRKNYDKRLGTFTIRDREWWLVVIGSRPEAGERLRTYRGTATVSSVSPDATSDEAWWVKWT